MATTPAFTLSEVRPVPANVTPNLDPRLQWLIACRQSGVTRAATSSTGRDEVAVIARVTRFSDWENLSEVRGPTDIGPTSAGGERIVTGRIPISRIEEVRVQPFVKSLKAARELTPQLSATTSETEAQPAQLPNEAQGDGGAGVVVGVIDYGIDVAHQNFRHTDGTTRLERFWNQDGPSSGTSPFGYGKEYTATKMNLALQSGNPYTQMEYDPAWYEDPGDRPGSHGTHVMDIAAGNGRGSGVPGMAPNADLMFVNISHAKDPTGLAAVGKSFGDSVRLLEAVLYLFDKAGERPCVVNISLGTNGGPHDGSTLVEQGLDAQVSAKPNRAVVLAAANSFVDGIHATGTVTAGGTFDLLWEVTSTPVWPIELEVWYAGADRFSVDLIDSDGAVRATVGPGQNKTLSVGSRVVFVSNRLNDPNNHDNMIGVFLADGIAPGTYTVRLRGDTVTNGRFHAWIERDNTGSSRFSPPHDNSHTIGSISCGQKTIAVGSYDAHKPGRPLSFFTSSGPTRDGRQKPEVSAPGHNVRAALSSSGTGTRLMSGTSMASPAVAGLVALMLSEANARGLSLTVDQVREILIDTCRRTPPSGTAWHPQYGNGRVHAKGAVEQVIALDGGGGGGGAPTAAGGRKKAAKKKPKKK